MTKKDLIKLRTRKVYWDSQLDQNRGTFKVNSGVLQVVGGKKNVMISGNWYWYPDLKNLRTEERSPWL